MSERSRNWCFTINNYTEEEVENLKEADIKYMIVGHEVGESGTPHLQGFCHFINAVRFATVVGVVGNRAHIQRARGNIEQNYVYCSKQGNFFEVGERPMSPKEKGEATKRRYEETWNAAREGDFDAIDYEHRIRYYGTLKRIAADALLEQELENLDHLEKMEWYYGESGTGKSLKARTDHPNAYLKMCNKWWDGYDNQDVVIIEDFDKAHSVLCHHMKIWADIYPFLAEKKGTALKIRPKKIIVTSNYHPNEIWTSGSDLAPILRRFRVTEFLRM